MIRVVSLICWLAVPAVAHGQPIKDAFLNDYRKSADCESRLTKNLELTVTGKTFDESGKVVNEVELLYHTSDTCVLVRQVSNPGNHLTWVLLRPEGSYRIIPSTSKPNEYVLKEFKPGSFAPSEGGMPFVVMVAPITRLVFSLRDHIASSRVEVLADETKGSVRDLKVREKLGDTPITTFRFRTKDMLLDEVFGVASNGTSGPFRFKYHYVDIGADSYPARVERFNSKPGGKMWLAGLTEYRTYTRASFPDSEFSLTRFGLPETVSTYRRTPIYVWLILAAVACGIMAYLLRRAIRKVEIKKQAL